MSFFFTPENSSSNRLSLFGVSSQNDAYLSLRSVVALHVHFLSHRNVNYHLAIGGTGSSDENFSDGWEAEFLEKWTSWHSWRERTSRAITWNVYVSDGHASYNRALSKPRKNCVRNWETRRKRDISVERIYQNVGTQFLQLRSTEIPSLGLSISHTHFSRGFDRTGKDSTLKRCMHFIGWKTPSDFRHLIAFK